MSFLCQHLRVFPDVQVFVARPLERQFLTNSVFDGMLNDVEGHPAYLEYGVCHELQDQRVLVVYYELRIRRGILWVQIREQHLLPPEVGNALELVFYAKVIDQILVSVSLVHTN